MRNLNTKQEYLDEIQRLFGEGSLEEQAYKNLLEHTGQKSLKFGDLLPMPEAEDDKNGEEVGAILNLATYAIDLLELRFELEKEGEDPVPVDFKEVRDYLSGDIERDREWASCVMMILVPTEKLVKIWQEN